MSATNESDALASSSNYGADTFLGRARRRDRRPTLWRRHHLVTGTSASAAVVAGAAGVLAALTIAGPGVIVGRLARNADAAGTADQTGNGRLNLGRAVGDTGTIPVASRTTPIANGGPFVAVLAAADEVSGIVKNDLNGNGVDNVGEPLLGGVPIILWQDRNANSVFEPLNRWSVNRGLHE